MVLQTPTVGPLSPTLVSGPKPSPDPYDNHHRPHLHLVNGFLQYLAMLIVTKNKKPHRLLPPPLFDLFTVSLSTFVV